MIKSSTAGKSFVTIDDLIEQAHNLFSGLRRLSEYKHPLDVRRGIRKEVENDMTDDTQSKQIKASGRTYFFDIERTKEGQPYLRITESRKGEGDRWERNRIHVFPEDTDTFAQAVSEMVSKVGQQ